MSFQAYLDNIKAKTGKSADDFVKIAKEKNLTTYKEIVEWLKTDFGLGLGHARAIVLVIKNRSEATSKIKTEKKPKKKSA